MFMSLVYAPTDGGADITEDQVFSSVVKYKAYPGVSLKLTFDVLNSF